MPIKKSLLVGMLCAVFLVLSTSVTQAQLTTQGLLSNYVEKVGPEYKDVEDAILIFRRGNVDGAFKLLVSAETKHRDLPPAEILLSHLCFAYNQEKRGRAMLELAVVKVPGDPEPFVMMADLAMRTGRIAEADVLFARGLELCGDYVGNDKRKNYLQVNALGGLAMVDERRGIWKQAEEHLREWIKVDEKNVAARSRLAKTQFFQENYDGAKATLVALKELDDKQPEPTVSMGVWYEQTGKRDLAKSSMEEALQKAPEDIVTRLAVATWALNAGDVDMAEENAKETLKLEPKSIRAKLVLGMVTRFRNDPAGAESAFKALHDESPSNFDAMNHLALAMLDQTDATKHRKALELAQVNVRANPDMRRRAGREAAATLAWALYRLERDAAAERAMQAVMRSGEISPDAAYYAAKIHHRRGHTSVAEKLLRGALASTRAFPDRDDAESLLAALSADSNSTGGDTNEEQGADE